MFNRLAASLCFIVFLTTSCNQHLGEPTPIEGDPFLGIIGGKQVSERSTPASRSVVILELVNREGKSFGSCTATLVGAHAILTAAHCFDPRISGIIQSFNIVFESEYKSEGNRTIRRGLKYKPHPNYNSERDLKFGYRIYDHDIAVGVFSGEIPSGYAAVRMDSDKVTDHSNQYVYVYGYGRSVDYSGTPGEDARYSWGKLRRGIMKIYGSYLAKPDRYFSAPDSANQLCQGDSGGPQFIQDQNGLRVIGVNSASNGPWLPNGFQKCSGPSQVTKVAPFQAWINDQIRRML